VRLIMLAIRERGRGVDRSVTSAAPDQGELPPLSFPMVPPEAGEEHQQRQRARPTAGRLSSLIASRQSQTIPRGNSDPQHDLTSDKLARTDASPP